MALLELNSVAFGYSDERVIREASGQLQPGQRIGLVGPNGGGKTTLLRLLAGQLAPEAGRIQRTKDLRLAVVSQSLALAEGDTLFGFVRSGAGLDALRARLDELHHALEQRPGDDALHQRYGELEAQYATRGGHELEHRVARLLVGLSFEPGQYQQPLSSMSGGQRQKAALARALLSDSNCFILDEPTNHLDLDAQAFLVDQLRALPREAGVLLVSHDRWLLDELATHIWELEAGLLYRYPGNYSKYVPLREERRKQAAEQYQRQREQIARTEEYIRRNIAGQNTKQAQGRRTHLARLERLENVQDDPVMRFALAPELTPGEQLLIVEDLAFGYEKPAGQSPEAEDKAGQPSAVRGAHSAEPVGSARNQTDLGPGPSDSERRPAPEPVHVPPPKGLSLNPPLAIARSTARAGLLVDGVSFHLYRGERLGIVGPNGCGKTTLLRLLAKRLAPLHGLIAWGTHTALGVFSQDSADLSPGHNLLAELRRAEGNLTDGQAREWLARFGFSGDDVMQDVGSLSGGEKSRLSLAKIFRRRPNVLLLDEPTNHLDIYAREALESFLLNYGGSIVLVTHDRALLERVCDRLLVFERGSAGETAGRPATGSAYTSTWYRGDYRDYLAWKAGGEAGLPGGMAGGVGGVPLASSRGSSRPAGGTPALPAAPVDLEAAKRKPPQELNETELSALARAGKMSSAAYCHRQRERAEQTVSQLEKRIVRAEDELKLLWNELETADRLGDTARVVALHAQASNVAQLALDALYHDLDAAHALAEAWLLRAQGA
jgi:ATP-binding cassette subfamily F protein 3